MSYATEFQLKQKTPLSSERKKEAKELLEKQWKEESILVKGVFKNLECPGATESFPFRKYPQDNPMIYTLEDGKTYEIPLAVARHINNTCNEKVHKYIVDSEGKKTIDRTKGRQRFQFLSTEFM